MKINFTAKNFLGKWAVRLGVALVVLAALSLIFAVAVEGNPAVIFFYLYV